MLLFTKRLRVLETRRHLISGSSEGRVPHGSRTGSALALSPRQPAAFSQLVREFWKLPRALHNAWLVVYPDVSPLAEITAWSWSLGPSLLLFTASGFPCVQGLTGAPTSDGPLEEEGIGVRPTLGTTPSLSPERQMGGGRQFRS